MTMTPTPRLVPDRPSDADKLIALEANLAERYRVCEDTVTPSSILLAVLNAVADVNRATPAALAHPSRGVVDDAMVERAALRFCELTKRAPELADSWRSIMRNVLEHAQAAALPGHGFADAGIEASQKATFVPCDCGCGRSCCAHCGNDVGFVTEKAALPAVPDEQVARNMERVRSEAFNLADTVIEWIESGNVQAARDAIRDSLFALAALPAVPEGLTADDVQWVVNDNAELGVMIRGQCFFLYKGNSLVYEDARHDDGRPMQIRTVGKREFGECCHPVVADISACGYPHKWGTVSLDDSDRWQPLLAAAPAQEAKGG